MGYSKSESANVDTCFDVGSILGSMVLGALSDRIFNKRSPVAFTGIIIAAAIVFTITFLNETMTKAGFYVIMLAFGFFIYGLNNLVSASCAADLGKSSAQS